MQSHFARKNIQRFSAVVMIAALFGVSMHRVQAAEDAKLAPSGTIDIDQTRVSFIGSANGGGGTLHFRGHDYPFSLGGLGIGGIGISKLKASGEVYNLTDPMNFPGTYSELRTGVALGAEGSGHLWLKNDNGVTLELRGPNKGVGLNLGADAISISYKK